MKISPATRGIIAALFISAVVIVSTATYQRNVHKALENSVELTLTEVINRQSYIVEMFINYNVSHVENIAFNFSSLAEGTDVLSDSSDAEKFLSEVERNLSYNHIYMVLDNGSVLTKNGFEEVAADSEIFEMHESSNSEIRHVSTAPFTGESTVIASAPITSRSGERLGTAFAHVPQDVLDSLLQTGFNGTSVTFIIENTGNTIAVSDSTLGLKSGDNVVNNLNEMNFDKFGFVNDLQSLNVAAADEGYYTYTLSGVVHKMKYTTMPNTDWVLIITVPENVVASSTNYIIFNTTLLLVEIVIILLITWFRMIMISKRHLKEVSNIAYRDSLTGIYNEKKFKIEMQKTLEKHKNEQFTIVKIDIINFKVANNILSYEMGNKIIQIVASTALAKDNKDVLFARISADEFLLFSKISVLNDVRKIKEIYENEVNTKIKEVCGRTFKFRYSRYSIPLGETNVNEIINTIDLTHSFSKQRTFEGIFDYEDNLKKQILHTAYICDIMHDALKGKEYKVYLQPKYSLVDDTICGAEALVRWQRPNGKFIYPNEFIYIFEQEGFITELDKYMLHNVCKLIKRFKEKKLKELPISINFSRMHMLDENFTNEVEQIVDSYGIPHHLIEIEMTETSMIDNEEVFKQLFFDLHNKGFSLSMDDFGAGYSSLALLTELNFDVIKLDKSLLTEALDKDSSALVIETILNMSKQLNLKTVCEGVETKGQAEFLKVAGCDIAQGYFYAKPMPNEDFEKLI